MLFTLGIDVSKDTLECSLKSENAQGRLVVRASKTFKNTMEGHEAIKAWLCSKVRDKSSVNCLMEATGVYHEDILYYLYDNGFTCFVVLPNKIHHYAKCLNFKAKTDKIDAALIADYGTKQIDTLEPWQPTTTSIRSIRTKSRLIEEIDDMIVVLRNHLHALKTAYNTAPEVINECEKLLKYQSEAKKNLEKMIDQEIENDPEMKALAQEPAKVKGLTHRTVARVLAETNCFRNITSLRKATSYAGLDVIVQQSGASCKRTSISKRGNSHLRRLLYMGALTSGQFDNNNSRLRQRMLDSGHKPKQWIIAITRKLLCLIFTLTKYRRIYDPNYNWHKANNIKPKAS